VVILENSQYIVLGIGGVCLVIGIVLVVIGALTRRKLGVIRDTPTVDACEVAGRAQAVGSPRVEVKGTVVADQPMLSPRTQTPCVYYRYKLEYRIERRERDSQGNYVTREHWDTVEDRKDHVPFRINDATGAVWVTPKGADFVAESNTSEGYGRPHERERSTGSMIGDVVGGVLDSLDGEYEDVRGYRETEELIKVGQPVYVLGTASCSSDGTASVGKGEGHFIISHKGEEELTKKYGRNYILQYVFGAILAVGGIAAMIYAVAGM
jgi:hypothetical protein